jgi:hypothetical protein
MFAAVLSFGALSPPTRAAVRMAAPQYTAQAAVVTASHPVSPNGASWLLSLRGLESDVAYQPGHVMAIEVSAGEGAPMLKGPYTVTRSDARTVDVIYRVIVDEPTAAGAAETGDHVEAGALRKTAAFKALKPGDEGVRFGGEFKVPILDGVSDGAAHVVLISSGAGVGAPNACPIHISAGREPHGRFTAQGPRLALLKPRLGARALCSRPVRQCRSCRLYEPSELLPRRRSIILP